ncbi:RagB/SusD family nutrient uptake outer membrane protein [Sphingobacterium faecale]|uniref:RagB/SusD family nutrient uptake outer membrane protein n=1 Tax=Sphingobacterium faecale TaxID=2803775 RepID=A0ABS1R0P8_9SPHI|nr:RagB/SusD family nutrient uptake outer membrane protein [Sphingobacterium faecale]MBL1408272.1 RagB/SusD family nutrient uptake outer membrane protein [Sphingobacterium faecale]
MYKYILILLSFGLLYGCSLEEEPYGFYSENNFYKTNDDAESALFYAYNTFSYNEYVRAIYYINELATESCDVKGEESFGSQEINNWDFSLFRENEQLELYYKYCYIAINRANAVIDNVSKGSLPQEFKNRVLGEAYFLRAWNYYHLVQTYGLVPLHKSTISSVTQTAAPFPASMDEIYDFIISDCLEAEKILQINKVVGRVDKVGAQSLLAKVYLSIASSKESQLEGYLDMQKDVGQMYAEAEKWSRKVLYDQNTYGLSTQLLDIYDTRKPDGPEHIFIMSMDKSGIDEGNFSSIDKMFIPYRNGVSLWFLNPDGSYTRSTNMGWGVFVTTDMFANSFANNDRRKTQLMAKRYYTKADGSSFEENDYYLTRKYIDPDFVGSKSSVRPFLIRFSEIALVFSEAAGPTSEGYYWVNEIRKRAGLNELQPGLGNKEFRDAIVKERSFELAFEGKRLHDLRRKAMLVKTDPKALASGITEEQAAFYPIPQKEVDLNPNIPKK